MAGSGDELDVLDLPEHPAPTGPTGPDGGAGSAAPRPPRRRRSRRRTAAALAAGAAAVVAVGLVAQARTPAPEPVARAGPPPDLTSPVRMRPFGEVVDRAVAAVVPASAPLWGPLEEGGGSGGSGDGVRDVQRDAVLADGQHLAFRVLAGVPSGAGLTPCVVPTAALSDWAYAEGGDATLGCTATSAGVRGSAVRAGVVGTGAHAVSVVEVVRIDDRRVVSVATWSTGGAPLSLTQPQLGALAGALVADGR